MLTMIQHILGCALIVGVYTLMSMEFFIQRHEIDVPGHFHWTHESIANKALYCSRCCLGNFSVHCGHPRREFAADTTAVCCTRRITAQPFWLFRSKYANLTSGLDIKYRDNGTGFVDVDRVEQKNDTFYILKHRYGKLSCLPYNLCDFPSLVEIWLEFNEIEQLINHRCLPFLDTLILSHNQIRAINGSVFSGMSYLRDLNLSDNLITYIEPNAFKYRPGSLASIQLIRNRLISIDISNLILGYIFRNINYAGNSLSNITNVLNWGGFGDSKNFGGGAINIRYNKFLRIPPLSELGFDKNSALTLTWNYVLYMDGNPWFCDCISYEYIKMNVPIATHFDGIIFECASPPKIKGYSLRTFSRNPNLLDLLICNITLKEKCPPLCHCFKQPSRNKVVINCSYSGRRNMLKVVPDLSDLDINLSHNMIQSFISHDYLNRTRRIDLSHNRIVVIDSEIYRIRNLDFISLHHNRITNLHRFAQLKNPCKLRFGNLTLSKCTCEMRWVKFWLQRPKQKNCFPSNNVITCVLEHQNVDISFLSENDMCPRDNSYVLYAWFTVPSFFIALVIVIYCNFRYEIQLLLRTKMLKHKNQPRSEFDVYLSFDLEDDEVRKWVVKELSVHLEKQGYKVCVPFRDFDAGGIHVEQIHLCIAKSQSFIVVINKGYLNSQLQMIEWGHIWSTFKSEKSSRIVVVNFDLVPVRKVENIKLKAFIRLGYSLDFCNLNKNLLIDVETQLGLLNR